MRNLAISAAVLPLLASAAWAWNDPYAAGGNAAADDPFLYDESSTLDPSFSTPSYEPPVSASYPTTESAPRPFVPNDFYVEFFGNMSLASQHSRCEMGNVSLTLPLISPAHAVAGPFRFDVRVNARYTWIRSKGEDVLDVDSLYSLGLRATALCKLGSYSQFQIGFTPQLNSDFDVMSSENFYWGGFIAFSSRAGENFRYSLGLAVMPDYYNNYVMPLLSLTWRYNPAWELRMRGPRLSLVNVAGNRFEWGPFLQWNAGVWTVHRHGETQQFRVSNAVAGISAAYDFSPQSSHLRGVFDIGSSFYNSYRVRDKYGDDTMEKYRGHPSLYLRAALQMPY